MTLAAIRVMRLMAPPAYFSSPNLLPIIAMQIVSLTAKFGRAPASGYGFVIYGMIHCAVLGNIKQGLAYGSLAREMAATPEAAEVEGSVQMMFAGFVRHWSVPLVETLPIFLTGAEKALSVGDLEFHGYNRYGHASYALMAGQSLPRISEYLEQHLAAVTEAAHEKTLGIMTMARASVNRMRGLPNDPKLSAVINKNFDIWTEQQDATSLAYHHKYQMLEHLMVGNYESALGSAKGMTANLNGILSMAYQPFYQFYEALCLIELSHSAGALKKRAMVARAQFLTRRLAKWAKHSPATLDHRVALLRAELAALSRKTSRAISGFDKAVAMARQSAALHDIGLFLERAGRFYLDQGSSEVAAIHLQSAIDAHNVWGGQTWAESITTRYPDNIRSTTIAPDASSVSSSLGSAGSLDARSLINTAVALAQKTSLEEIVVEVMQAIAMNAGATNGALILLADDTLKVVAELAPGEKVTMSKNQTLADCKHLPQSIINFVHHANERVVLDDATADETFGSDPYIKDARPFSILCAPLIFKGATVGFIYLENPGVRHAFTPERCHVVEVLAGQAAISIDNAGLFEKLNDALERQVDLTSAHARFVPHTFLEILDRPSITDVKLGDYVKGPASILFSDIRGFTALIEQLDPDEAIVFINEYLSLMEPPVLANGGFVDSYIGDAVMAVFDRGPEAAIDAGIAMARGLRSWKGGASRGMTGSIRIGIGIATGNIIFGTIGAANRLKCGVIGDTVNLASRIEGLTKFYETRMLITSETRDALPDPDRYGMREIDLVTVVGRDAPISILEIFDADSEDLREQKAKTVVPLKAGLEEFRTGNIPAALKLFKQCAKLAPDDPVSQKLIARCKNERANAKEPDWDGIQRFERK